MNLRRIPEAIETGCPELDLVWREHAGGILDRPGVLIPDTDPVGVDRAVGGGHR